jgi:hypothetical protein
MHRVSPKDPETTIFEQVDSSFWRKKTRISHAFDKKQLGRCNPTDLHSWWSTRKKFFGLKNVFVYCMRNEIHVNISFFSR